MISKKIKLLTLIICSILTIHSVGAVPKGEGKNRPVNNPIKQTVRIHYRVNQTVIERDYMDNAYAFKLLNRIFTDHPADDIDYIIITGNASPEGNVQNNRQLSEQRALSFKNYILSDYPEFRENQIHTVFGGEDWDGLVNIIENDGRVPHRTELLDLLSGKLSREEQKKRMMSLGNGQTYKYLQKYVLPRLRGGVSAMIYFKNDVHPAVVQTDTVTIEKVRTDTVYLEKTVYTPQEVIVYKEVEKAAEKKPFYIAVKNNLLYDAALLPNLSLEIPFGRAYEWSVAVEGNWSWWDTGAEKYNYHRIQMAGAEVRRWFGNRTGNPLNGWYVGVYGYGGDYDVRLFAKKNSDTGEQSLWSYSAGLSIGYAIPLGRRFNLEFGLGVGYFGGDYKKYDVSDCQDGVFPLLSTHHRNFFGPAKAGISLVWLVGSGVNNSKRKEALQ